jgi:hypothetical protein
VKEEYPGIHGEANNILLQFPTSYMCEQAFSCLTSINSTTGNGLISAEDELCLGLSKDPPTITHLCSKKQRQVSH